MRKIGKIKLSRINKKTGISLENLEKNLQTQQNKYITKQQKKKIEEK